MTLSRGVISALLTFLGIVVVLGVILIAASFLGSDAPVKPLIVKGIQLREAEDPVVKAQLITELDDLVAQAENEELTDQWDRMMDCLGKKCPDQAYLDYVLVNAVAFETELPESSLLINIIATAKYWDNSDHLLEFSRAVSLTNEQIDALESKKARNEWQDVVDCDGQCPEKYDLFFELIKTVVQ